MKVLASFLLASVMMMSTNTGRSEILAGWKLHSRDLSGSITADDIALHIVGGLISRGPGLTPDLSIANGYGSQGWSTSPTFPGIDSDSYYSITFTVESGWAVNLASMDISYSSPFAPPRVNAVEIRYAGDGYSTVFLQGGVGFSGDEHTISFADLTGLTGTVEFRLWAYSADSLTALFLLDNDNHFPIAGSPVGAVRFNGDVVPVTPPDIPPTALAGLDQNVRVGQTVHFDGSGSFDDNTESTALDYSWSIISRPSGSTATLTGADTATPSFVVDVAGTYDVQLVVTDEAGLSSTPDHVICSSANLAPTSVATVDFSLVIIGKTAHLDGSTSHDPELDQLSYSWTITAKPLGSVATLVNSATATPTLTPDVAGVYQVTLVVSDFIGPGTPASVQITATTVAGFAELQIVHASGIISGLTSSQITTKGNQTALLNFLSQAVVALQEADVATAIDKLQKSIARTDGCVLRGSPDGSAAGRDWITECAAQIDVYSLLNAALDALTQ